MDRELHQLRVKRELLIYCLKVYIVTGYNTHKDEALYTALNNTATLSEKSA